MNNESYENFQYDSCISRGICSLNPKTSALQTVLVLYLRLFAKYAKEIPIDLISEDAKLCILNTIAIAIYNTDFNENSFINSVNNFRKYLPEIMEEYHKLYPEIDIDAEKSKPLEIFRESSDIIRAIQFGERIFLRGQEKLSAQIRDFYNIMLVIANSISINLLDLKSYNKDFPIGFEAIFNLLSQIDIQERDFELLKKDIEKASQIDIELMNLLHQAQEEIYGKQKESEVSFSTTPNKAILVVGSNIKELENILEAFKNENIDIYTHDEMMLAHTFPEFKKYPNLKGQFGQGIESCLIDFATFPGPIILTKHSLHNIENLYRGRLFTTDENCPQGVIKIKDNNFTQVIESARESKGFKHGKQCETVIVGYDFDEVCAKINEKLAQNKYDYIFLIGLDAYSLEQKVYYEKLTKLAPQNVLIISFSYDFNQENVLNINACFDSYSLLRVFEYIKNNDATKIIFFPKCERNSLSQMIYISNNEKSNVYVGKCVPIILNPTLLGSLEDIFEIYTTTSCKKDLERIFKNK